MINRKDENNLFFSFLFKKLAENWKNELTDNFDHLRFGQNEHDLVNTTKNLSDIAVYAKQFELMYDLLEDRGSKEIFLQLLAFRILGHKKVRLPLSQPLYWESINNLKNVFDFNKKVKVNLTNSSRDRYYTNLNTLGFNVELFAAPRTILTQFLLKQYEYTTEDNISIGVQPGDIVIDGGACWGETTIFFANQVTESGKIFSFEFIPGNIELLNKNIELNPKLRKRIELLKNPLWFESNVKMYFQDRGPASRVSLGDFNESENETYSLTIDDLCEQKKLEKVDFIKMDIEGAEQNAIKGAEKTIKKFKPKLAISIYHSMDDFANIIHLINGYNVGYKFYLNHFTIYSEETVLFATTESKEHSK